jgi:hypothetical protein
VIGTAFEIDDQHNQAFIANDRAGLPASNGHAALAAHPRDVAWRLLIPDKSTMFHDCRPSFALESRFDRLGKLLAEHD